MDSLLYEIRSWEPGIETPLVEDLARRFRLDPLIVFRILEAEGLEVDQTLELDEPTDASPRRVTCAIDVEELERARRRAAGGDAD